MAVLSILLVISNYKNKSGRVQWEDEWTFISFSFILLLFFINNINIHMEKNAILKTTIWAPWLSTGSDWLTDVYMCIYTFPFFLKH